MWHRLINFAPSAKFRTAAFYFVCLSVPIVFDYATNHIPQRAYRPGESFFSRIWKADYWYQSITSAGRNTPKPRFVTLVTLTPGIEKEAWLSLNRCTHRVFIGKLIESIADHGPSMLVVDRWYSPMPTETCGSDQPSNMLVESVGRASSRAHVVLAIDSLNSNEIYTDGSCRPVPHLVEDEEDVLVEPLKFKSKAGSAGIDYGLARLDDDLRRLPLAFWAFNDCSSAQRHVGRSLYPTLTGAVAAYLGRTITTDLIIPGHHPYTNFMLESEFPQIDASKLICGLENCTNTPEQTANLEKLRNRIVVIGQRDGADIHGTPVGKMQGMVIHANYIESVLWERFFVPLNPVAQILISLGWFLVIDFLFKLRKLSPEMQLVVALAVTALLSLVLFSVIIVYWGVFFAILPPTVLAILGKYLSRRFDVFATVSREMELKPAADAGAPTNNA